MQHQKSQMGKRQFRIGDLAKELGIKKFVIRFWEKEFDLKADRSEGGQRFYTQDDLRIFKTIKSLLYSEGFTIAGAKKQLEQALEEQKAASASEVSSLPKDNQKTSLTATEVKVFQPEPEVSEPKKTEAFSAQPAEMVVEEVSSASAPSKRELIGDAFLTDLKNLKVQLLKMKEQLD